MADRDENSASAGRDGQRGVPRDPADRRLGLGLFAISVLIFAGFSAPQNLDSRYALLVGERLISTGTFHLDGVPGITPAAHDDQAGWRAPSNLVRIDDHYFYFFPPGTPFLAAPFVGVARALGFGITDERGRYLHHRETLIGRLIASLLMAGLCAIFFFSA